MKRNKPRLMELLNKALDGNKFADELYCERVKAIRESYINTIVSTDMDKLKMYEENEFLARQLADNICAKFRCTEPLNDNIAIISDEQRIVFSPVDFNILLRLIDEADLIGVQRDDEDGVAMSFIYNDVRATRDIIKI